MTNEEQMEWDELEKELLKYGISDDEDDLLADIPKELLEKDMIIEPEDIGPLMDEILLEEKDTPIPAEPSAEEHPAPERKPKAKKGKNAAAAKKRDDKWVVGLMIAISFLCIGIIGVLIYWLEVFLKFA
ncbi:MAG: hypothetical protein E7462_00120 [Ruminococcaceae bacterium]|nr:hypothetical protein [Oscillospiraceae bacterium]